jgi:D-3-phosphoglycerate dehydrogenase / 2-oxoglutarate reductase
MPHILVAGRIHDAGKALLREAPGVTVEFVDDGAASAYVPHITAADALLVRTQPVTRAVLAQAPNLKIVSRHGVGYDAVEMPALNERKIPCVIVGDVNSRAVAEHTLMLILAVARKTIAHDVATRSGPWELRNAFAMTELDGKTLVLIGFGRIGRRVAHLTQAFGMTVLAHDPFVPAEAFAAAGVQRADTIAEALPRADVLSVHMPAPQGGGTLLGAAELARMKPTAMIINTARGGLVEEAALDAALRAGKLQGAGLDVLVEEPPKPDHPLLSNPRVTLSPHAAGLTEECAKRMALSSAQNILDFFAGSLDPALVVNRAANPRMSPA